MAKESRSVAFIGGELKSLATLEKGCECVLALHLNRLIVKMLRVPAEQDPVEVATPILKAMSPFPDDPLTVSCETVREDAREKIVIAAAFPDGASDDIGEALDAKKLSVTRIDALIFGQLRYFCSGQEKFADGQRRLLKFASPDCLSMVVMDGDMPVAIRAIATGVEEPELKRETMLLLLEAEDFGGPKDLAETIEAEFTDDALAGIDDRSADPNALNALPEGWGEVLDETRFKGKLTSYMIAAIGLWVVVMGVLFGVPVAYGFMTDHQKDLSKQHSRQYREVKEMKSKIDLVSEYSDRARSALELMKAVSDRLPAGITLNNWDFRFGENIRISGDAEQQSEVLDFKDKMTDMTAGEDEDAERVFTQVQMGALRSQKNGGQYFTLDLVLKAAEGDE